jgi:hypothetical protein
MRRTAALALLVLGQSLVATLDPTVALMPAFATFLGAGTLMAKATLDEHDPDLSTRLGNPGRAPEPSGGKVVD